MWLKAILLAAATVVPSVLGLNVTTYCDTPAMTPEQLRTYKNVAANITENKRKGIATAKSGYERALIKVYVHVVSASLGWDDGWVKIEQVRDQVNMLNVDFLASNFLFTLAGVDYSVNATWAVDLDEMGMKRALRKGTYQDLNLYYLKGFQRPGLAGYCTYPAGSVPRPGSDSWFRDGCTMNHDVMYGTPTSYEYNLGRVTIHEVGHWLGLRHTFEGGCNDGDAPYVMDTPAEAEAAFGCPTGRDSCPDQPGLDPIGNHMDYTWDRCKKDGFTKDQSAIMQHYYWWYRQGI